MKISLINKNINKINKLNLGNLIIGNFDAVHKGHKKLILKNKVNTALVIKNIPSKSEYLYSFNQKIKQIYNDLLISNVLVFDLKFQNVSGIDFINNFLNKLNISSLTVGSDFLFGKDRMSVEDLKKYLDPKIKLRIITRKNNSLSTTNIKKMIKEGNVKLAQKKLVSPYHINAKVIHGNQIASKILGYPTANIKCLKKQIIPHIGIYSTKTILNNAIYDSITFIGKSKTFGASKITIETHLINYNGSTFYGDIIDIIFNKKIGNVKKYKNIENLKSDIKRYIDIVLSNK